MITSAFLTDIGKKRKINQDYVFASDEPVGSFDNLYIVADGMGGHNAGDYASKYAVESVVREIRGSVEQKPFRIMGKAIRNANELIRERAREDADLYGMGTTIVCCSVHGRTLQVANVGDSRLYLFSHTLRQITRDHSLVEEMVRMGGMTKEAARLHPDKNIITRAVGARDSVEVDFFTEELDPGDLVLLCSDGLTNMVTDDEIAAILGEDLGIIEKARKLVEKANENGGRDNIAVVIIDADV